MKKIEYKHCHCERKRSNLYLLFHRLPRPALAGLAMTLIVFFTLTSVANAQTPSTWQNNATGLKTSVSIDKKTAGLTTTINATGIPFMSLQGGVKNAGNGNVNGPVGIDLGEIKLSGTTPALTSEVTDWAHNQMTFSNNLSIWVSRLSPAVLIQNLNNSLRLFSGNLNGGILAPGSAIGEPWRTTVVQNRILPVFPKYIAYSTGGSIQIKQIPASSSASLNLPALDNNWVLVWYGNNSNFVETKVPLAYSNNAGHASSSLPVAQAYLADAPMLLKFENNPTSIQQSPEGGIDLKFTANSGYTSMMPLFGREHLKASDTEGWGTISTLPVTVAQKINFWTSKLCSYPTNVSETYDYDATTDTAKISENITYLPVCAGGSTTSGFAILPPMLSIAKGALGANFSVSKTLTDASYPTEFGPILGVDNTNTYSYSVKGLKKYTDSKRINASGSVPAELSSELNSEVQKIISAGHMAPWIFVDSLSMRDSNGDIYFLNPGDNLYQLTEIAGSLPNSQQKTDLINYIKTERSAYPPETVANLLPQGIQRGPFAVNNTRLNESGSLNVYNNLKNLRPDIFSSRVSLYNFYGLSKYYDLTLEPISATVSAQAKIALDNDTAEQDWATLSWFKAFTPKRIAVIGSNRYLAGLIGFNKIIKAVGDTQAENLGRALLAKAVIQRLAVTKYPRYLYSSGLTVLPTPANPIWQPTFVANGWRGYIFNYNWTSAMDDPLQVVLLDQFGVYLNDSSGFGEPNTSGRDWSYVTAGYLVAYRDLVPEAARFLADYAKQEAEIYLKKAESFMPNWYVPFAEAVIGQEHNLNHPADSYQLFMAKALLQGDSPQNLAKYTSFSWLDVGDLFYMDKLAETIKAYQGWAWSDTITGQPCVITSLSWGSNTALVITPVSLTVSASGDCSSKQATFEVDQNGLGGGKMTDPTPKTSIFANNQASSTWTTQYTPKLLGAPEYYFKVSLDNGTTWSNNSAFLTVTQAVVPTPTPTPIQSGPTPTQSVLTPTPTRVPTIILTATPVGPTNTPTPTKVPTATPTPTLTPTPTPVPCSLASATWNLPTNPTTEGTQVMLNVATKGACNGQQLKFEVRKAGYLGPVGDSPVTSNPVAITINNSNPQTLWIAEYQPTTVFGVTLGLPSYYFRATLGGNNTSLVSKDPQLQVGPSNKLTITTLPSTQIATDSATIQWSTNQNASSAIEYGLPGTYTKATIELNTTIGVIDHQIVLPNLADCSTYSYRLVSKTQTAETATLTDNILTTKGCTGNANVLAQTDSKIATSSGGRVSLIENNIGAALSVPVNYASASAHFQIKRLEKTALLKPISVPAGKMVIGNHTYNFSALTDISTLANSFNNPITVEINYSSDELTGSNESSLQIYRFDGTTLELLQNCSLDKIAKIITCQTSNFSDFLLVGDIITTTTSTTTSNNDGGNSSGGGGGGSADLNHDGRVNVTDLSMFLRMWGQGGGSAGDINGSGRVDITDLSILLRSWSR